MVNKNSVSTMKENSPYTAVLTREQFLFYEVRTTAKLLSDGLSDVEIIEAVIRDNLFQYPTEKSIQQMVRSCIYRLRAMQDDSLIAAIATQPSEIAKQICLYAMMKRYRLVWDFMVTVIGEKYRLLDMTFSKVDLNAFFIRLQEQDDWVATWSDSTITKLKQVFKRMLVETGYIDSMDAEHINPVWLNPILENAIKSNNDDIILPAFNYFA